MDNENKNMVNGFLLVNSEKLDRVINGTLANDGAMKGGLGEDADPSEVIAAYDKIGGLITRNGDRVKTGSFYDFKKREARKKPEIVFVYRGLKGEEIEVADGVELPGEVKAARQQAAQEKEAAESAAPKKKGKKKAAAEEDGE